MKRSAATLIACLGLVAGVREARADLLHWELTDTLGPTEGSSELVPLGLEGGEPDATFDETDLGGASVRALRFGRGTALAVRHCLRPNGRGALVNQYTVLLDVRLDGVGDRWLGLWQTNARNKNDADWGVDPEGRVGVSRTYGGRVEKDCWHRLALVVDADAGRLSSYVDGQPAQEDAGLRRDGRWAMDPVVYLFADDDGETGGGWLASVQIHDRALTSDEIAALAGPSPGGIPRPTAPEVTLRSPAGGATLMAGSEVELRWDTRDPRGTLTLELWRGDKVVRPIGEVRMEAGRHAWRVPQRAGDGDGYEVRARWPGDGTSPAIARSGAFRLEGSLGPANPVFEDELASNGGFEAGLTGWRVVRGHPVVGAQSGLFAYRGKRYLLGGVADYVIRQEIDLVARGFTAGELDARPLLEASAALAGWVPDGGFDDQAFVRITVLDGAGRALRSFRTPLAGDSTWVERKAAGLLPAGARALQVDVEGRFRAGGTNDAMVDALSVRLAPDAPEQTARLSREPFLYAAADDAVVVQWETDAPAMDHLVTWGPEGGPDRAAPPVESQWLAPDRHVHRATLAGLEREARFRYRVQSGGQSSAEHTFGAGPRRSSAARIAFLADNQDGPDVLREILPRVAAERPQLLAFAGDIVQDGASLEDWDRQWFEPLQQSGLAASVPVTFARGNHDGSGPLAYAFGALPGNESWFAMDWGDCRLVFLDSEAATATSPSQEAWLARELQNPAFKDAAFRIVVLHRPPFTRLWDRLGYDGTIMVRKRWLPLLEAHGVDLLVGGHTHSYQRGIRKGVTHVLIGGAGGELDRVDTERARFLKVVHREHHYNLLEVADRTLRWTAYRVDGTVLDRFELPSRRVPRAVGQ